MGSINSLEHLQLRPGISKADSDTSIFALPTNPTLQEMAKLTSHDQAFENTSTSVAASQMRNALNNLADTVTDPDEKKVSPSTCMIC
jgi:UTP--glucose-1-phosphate uridylyltransferase